MSSPPGEKLTISNEIVKTLVYIAGVIISIMLFYGAIDKRVVILETENNTKIDRGELYEKLENLKKDINQKIESEIKTLKEELKNGTR
ncbi:MAG: hypothetical protein SCALA702_25730 [Melioribacteraceae bacterium]|nr:MAG: hypothetical protein SCALA702_25730 [Melioribacteraceae bacterium]